jgi:hypothetical protein
MKKQFFSFVMMLALVIVAGTAMAQLKTTPYPGGKYTYTINGLSVKSTGSATITPSNAGMVVSNIKDQASAPILLNAILTTTTALTFDITYDPSMIAGPQKITFELTDGGGCKNNIYLNVTVQAKPALALAIVGSADICQNLNATPANNVDASVGAANNTFTYTVTPTLTNIAAGYTYDFKLVLSPYVLGATTFAVTHTTGDGTLAGTNATGYTITGATSASHVFTVTFATTPGQVATTYTGTISLANLNVSASGATYVGTITTASDVVIVKSTPTIGTFN